MENKTNIAELLRGCPRGMELDCVMYEDVYFDYVLEGNIYPIKVQTPEGQISLNNYGQYSNNKRSKCVIFPKGKTTWEGFHIPFKDGDVLVTGNGRRNECVAIFKESKSYFGNEGFIYYALTSLYSEKQIFKTNSWATDIETRFATEEERQKLFDAIKAAGYKWNAETKTLEKLHTQKISWHTGIPENLGDYLVSLSDGRVSIDTYLESTKHWDRYSADQIVAWRPVDEIEPYNHN